MHRIMRKFTKTKGGFTGMLIQLCHANFSTTEKSYFLLIFNPNLSGNIMSSCDMVKAQSGSGPKGREVEKTAKYILNKRLYRYFGHIEFFIITLINGFIQPFYAEY